MAVVVVGFEGDIVVEAAVAATGVRAAVLYGVANY